MSKIVQAINSMISNSANISNVIKGENETFFLYKNKYKWSIAKRDDGYHLWFYPGNLSIDTMSGFGDEDWAFMDVSMVHYHDSEIGTTEAKASFAELYTLISEKVYGIDAVLDDIISDDLI